MLIADFFSFTEWYQYALLLVWLVLLFVGLKYFYLLESQFKPNDDSIDAKKYGKNLLIASFVLGLLMVLIFTFKPAQSNNQSGLNRDYAQYIFYGLFILLVIFNAFVSIRYYKLKSGIIRLLLMSALMALYFYSGMLGGLMMIAGAALFLIIYALAKFKKIVKIK